MSEARISRISTSPYRGFTSSPVQHIDVDTSKKLGFQEPYEKVQCNAKLSEDGERIIFETEELDKYEAEPVRKIRNLINGRVKSTRLTWIRPVDIISKIQSIRPLSIKSIRPLYIRQARRFVHPSTRLTQQQVEALEDVGLLPVQNELGETTRLVNFRLDTRTMNKLRILKHRLESSKKRKFEDSEVIRLTLLKGLKQLMQETSENKP